MDFKDKVVVVTGGAHGIGKCIVDTFKEKGAKIAVIDINENEYFTGDVGNITCLEEFCQKVIADFGHVDYIINNAKPIFKGIDECSYEEFNYALNVGVTAPFMIVKLLKDHLNDNASIINISSTRACMSQPQSESYSAAKGGLSSLTHALAISLAGKARVNSISPGWILVDDEEISVEDKNQHPVKRVGNVADIASLVLFLCSDEAGFITGENINVDGGMSKLMIYHNDHGWTYKG
ncbi:MAG: SDR family oxidoreductase [Erysipelotrichaceae bacterium]|nr:SDR family oxidoreductase [Erysipelotrichaceae bacterium]